ncbi:hypothetical protein [Balneatrix alpica]|uniref:Uncharacterized protein n=1 Tax=Balneatrix alpica TaxID=75684 RepID=A0ABV5ZCT0_9GAMM|nr:hypothetical protein [Balneatrix alpica]
MAAMRWEIERLEEQIAQVEKRLDWALSRDDEVAQQKLETQLEGLERQLRQLLGAREPMIVAEVESSEAED